MSAWVEYGACAIDHVMVAHACTQLQGGRGCNATVRARVLKQGNRACANLPGCMCQCGKLGLGCVLMLCRGWACFTCGSGVAGRRV